MQLQTDSSIPSRSHKTSLKNALSPYWNIWSSPPLYLTLSKPLLAVSDYTRQTFLPSGMFLAKHTQPALTHVLSHMLLTFYNQNTPCFVDG